MSDLTHILWTCEVCGSNITPHASGCVGIPFRELSARTGALRWRIQHNHCIDPDWDVYGFDLDQLDDPRKVLGITAHLMSKTWFGQSTWRGILMHLSNDRWAA